MRLQIDDLGFDSSSRQVWVDGKEVHLSPKAFDLLWLIIERRPHAVSKADLHARLWPDTFVTDSSLPSLVSEIRDAIADRRRKPRLIRTVHGFGYAFDSPQAAAAARVRADAVPAGRLVGASSDIALFSGENVLGREGAGVILLKSGTVSRRHARITIDGSSAVVEDLGSKNGTYVDDRPVLAPTAIVDGDQVRIGSLQLVGDERIGLRDVEECEEPGVLPPIEFETVHDRACGEIPVRSAAVITAGNSGFGVGWYTPGPARSV